MPAIAASPSPAVLEKLGLLDVDRIADLRLERLIAMPQSKAFVRSTRSRSGRAESLDDRSATERVELALVVYQRASGACRTPHDDFGQHHAMLTRRYARHDPAHQPDRDVVENGNPFWASSPDGGSSESICTAAGKMRCQFLLVFAKHVHADMAGFGDCWPAGSGGVDAEGNKRGIG